MRAVLTIGVPASGKSTYARSLGIHEINLDNCREIISGDPGDQGCTPQAVALHTQFVDQAISKGIDFCISDTNINKVFRTALVNKLRENNYKVTFVVFNTPIETCIERNGARGRQVPGSVISRMHDQLILQNFDDADEVIFV